MAGNIRLFPCSPRQSMPCIKKRGSKVRVDDVAGDVGLTLQHGSVGGADDGDHRHLDATPVVRTSHYSSITHYTPKRVSKEIIGSPSTAHAKDTKSVASSYTLPGTLSTAARLTRCPIVYRVARHSVTRRAWHDSLGPGGRTRWGGRRGRQRWRTAGEGAAGAAPWVGIGACRWCSPRHPPQSVSVLAA